MYFPKFNRRQSREGAAEAPVDEPLPSFADSQRGYPHSSGQRMAQAVEIARAFDMEPQRVMQRLPYEKPFCGLINHSQLQTEERNEACRALLQTARKGPDAANLGRVLKSHIASADSHRTYQVTKIITTPFCVLGCGVVAGPQVWQDAARAKRTKQMTGEALEKLVGANALAEAKQAVLISSAEAQILHRLEGRDRYAYDHAPYQVDYTALAEKYLKPGLPPDYQTGAGEPPPGYEAIADHRLNGYRC